MKIEPSSETGVFRRLRIGFFANDFVLGSPFLMAVGELALGYRGIAFPRKSSVDSAVVPPHQFQMVPIFEFGSIRGSQPDSVTFPSVTQPVADRGGSTYLIPLGLSFKRTQSGGYIFEFLRFRPSAGMDHVKEGKGLFSNPENFSVSLRPDMSLEIVLVRAQAGEPVFMFHIHLTRATVSFVFTHAAEEESLLGKRRRMGGGDI